MGVATSSLPTACFLPLSVNFLSYPCLPFLLSPSLSCSGSFMVSLPNGPIMYFPHCSYSFPIALPTLTVVLTQTRIQSLEIWKASAFHLTRVGWAPTVLGTMAAHSGVWKRCIHVGTYSSWKTRWKQRMLIIINWQSVCWERLGKGWTNLIQGGFSQMISLERGFNKAAAYAWDILLEGQSFSKCKRQSHPPLRGGVVF